MTLGSGSQEIYSSIYWFMQNAKNSNVLFPKIREWALNLDSIASLKYREKLSVPVICVPRMCAADTHIRDTTMYVKPILLLQIYYKTLIRIPCIFHVIYLIYIVGHYSDMFLVFFLAVRLYLL